MWNLLSSLAARSTVDCGFSRRGALEVYTTPASAEEAQARCETWRGWGLPVQWLPGAAVGMHGVLGAVFDPTAAKQLRDLHITPERAATRVTVSGYSDTVGYAVSNGDMTARHAARMLADA